MLNELTLLVARLLPPRDIREDVMKGRHLGDYQGNQSELEDLFDDYLDLESRMHNIKMIYYYTRGMCHYIRTMKPRCFENMKKVHTSLTSPEFSYYFIMIARAIVVNSGLYSMSLFQNTAIPDKVISYYVKKGNPTSYRCDPPYLLRRIAKCAKWREMYETKLFMNINDRLTTKNYDIDHDNLIIEMIHHISHPFIYYASKYEELNYGERLNVSIIESHLSPHTKPYYVNYMMTMFRGYLKKLTD